MKMDDIGDLTVNQRRALNKALTALEAMAGIWAAEVRLSELAGRLAEAPADQRASGIAAMIEQGFIEGAYRHFLDHPTTWVSVEDRLPPQDCAVLGYDAWDGDDQPGDVGYFLFVGGKFYNDDPDGWKAQGLLAIEPGDEPVPVGAITHWMPLPSAPDAR